MKIQGQNEGEFNSYRSLKFILSRLKRLLDSYSLDRCQRLYCFYCVQNDPLNVVQEWPIMTSIMSHVAPYAHSLNSRNAVKH